MDEARITRKQIARIWATAHDLGMDRQALYALVPGGSISHLTRAQAADLIKALDRLSALGKPPGPEEAERPPVAAWQATPAQIALIRSLFARLGWHDDPRRERGFLRKYAHVSAVEEIRDRKRAIAVIEALKAILARRERSRTRNEHAAPPA